MGANKNVLSWKKNTCVKVQTKNAAYGRMTGV